MNNKHKKKDNFLSEISEEEPDVLSMTSEKTRETTTTDDSVGNAAAWKQRGREPSGKGLPGIDPLTLQLYNEVVS